MLYHLKHPFKVEAGDGVFQLWWETLPLLGPGGLRHALRSAGETRWTEIGGPHRLETPGAGRLQLVFEAGAQGLRIIWDVRMQENFVLDLSFRLEETQAGAAERIQAVRAELCAAQTFDAWMDEDESAPLAEKPFPAARSRPYFCGGFYDTQGRYPMLWLESLHNGFGGFESLMHDRDGEKILCFALGSADVRALCRGAFPMGMRLVVCDRPGALRGFIARNRKRKPDPRLDALRAPAGAARRADVLLANPPWVCGGVWGVRAGSRWSHLKDPSEERYLPLPFFLAYAQALLTYCGYRSVLLDSLAEKSSEEEFIARCNAALPRLLVVETSTPSLPNDLRLLGRVDTRVQIVLCGPVGLLGEEKFWDENPRVSYALAGEYEMTLLDLVHALESGRDPETVAGLVFRGRDGKMQRNAPRALAELDLLPWPARETLPYFAYSDLVGDIPEPSAQMMSSRGCPYGCTFCLWPQLMYHGRNYRRRDAADVVAEMEYLVRVMGYRSVYIDDDTANIGRERWLEICAEILLRALADVPWAFMARADLMDAELLERLREAGLCAVKYGVESTSQELLDRVGKRMDLEKTFAMIRRTRELGIRVHLTFTLGLPGETRETALKTIRDAVSLDPFSVQFSINTPYPGTEIYEELRTKGMIVESDYSKFDGHYGGVVRTEHLSPEDLSRLKDAAYAMWAAHRRRAGGWRGAAARFVSYARRYSFLRAVRATLVHVYARLVARGVLGLRGAAWLRGAGKSGVCLLGWELRRGNVNSRQHAFGRGVIIDGGYNFAFAEYDFTLSRDADYNLYFKYANAGFRPVELFMDGMPVKKNALCQRTGGWTLADSKIFYETTLPLSAGPHTLRLYSSGLIPHVHKIILRAIDEDRGFVPACPAPLLEDFSARVRESLPGAGLKSLAPGAVAERFENLLRGLSRAREGGRDLMLAGVRDGRRAFAGPEHAVIDLTNRCAQGCVGCWLHAPGLPVDGDWQGRELEFNVVSRLLGELSQLGTRRVRFSGGGEPLLHPRAFEALALARALGIKTALTTGLGAPAVLEPDGVRKLIATGVGEIAVSLGAVDAGSFARGRPRTKTGDWEKILKTLETLAAKKSPSQTLTLCHVIGSVNAAELEEMYDLSASLGAEEAYFTLFDLIPGRTDFLALDEAGRARTLESARRVLEKSKKPGRPRLPYFETGFMRRLGAAQAERGQYDAARVDELPCAMGWYFARVLADGTLIPCCRAVDKKMGNVCSASFSDLWFSGAYNEFRWKALELKKTDPYFSATGCLRQCDNLMHNELIAARLKEFTARETPGSPGQ